MKVLHLSSESTWRGGEQQIGYLLIESKKLGLEVSVACRTGSPMSDFCEERGIPFIEMPFRSAYDLGTVRAVMREYRRAGFDFLHMHTSKSHTIGVIAGILGLKARMILSRRVDFAIKKNWSSRFKYNYSQLIKIVCISQEIERITRPDIKDPRRLQVIHSGIDPERFKVKPGHTLRKEYDIPNDHFLVGNTSAIADHKDYFTFVRTAKAVLSNNPRFHFFIIGDGPLKKELEDLVEQENLSSRIILTGFRSNIPELLSELNIFLFTSKTEGLGTSVLDAFSAGVPVVSTNAGGIPEMVENELTGIVRNVGDYQGLAEGILTVIKDSKVRKKIIDGAHEKLKSFTSVEMAKRYVDLYHSILDLH